MCHSDLTAAAAHNRVPPYPLVPGHELQRTEENSGKERRSDADLSTACPMSAALFADKTEIDARSDARATARSQRT